MNSASKPTALSTRMASSSTWFPIPSPGMLTMVGLDISAISDDAGVTVPQVSSFSGFGHQPSIRNRQFCPYQVLDSPCHHQRLWHAAQRWEMELLTTVCDKTGSEVHLLLVPWHYGLAAGF